MQVTHGEPLICSDQFVLEGRVYFDQAPDSFRLNSGLQRRKRSDLEQHNADAEFPWPAADAVSRAAPPPRLERPDCVGSLQLRAELLRVSSLLERLVPSRVVVHNDTVSSRLQRRLDEGAETKAFIAFDVERLVNQWGALRTLLPDVTPTVRASAGSRHVLAALVHALGVLVDVDSASGAAVLSGAVEDVAAVEACSPHVSASRADFTAACGADTAVIRTPSAIRKALLSGVSLMAVGSLSGIRNIRAAIRSAPHAVRSLPPPGLVISLGSSSVEQRKQRNSFSAGASLLKSQLVSFCAEDTQAALGEAQAAGLRIAGVHADVGSLLDGSVRRVVAQLVAARQGARSKEVLTVVLDGLDCYLGVETECGDNALEEIRQALSAVRSLGAAGVSVAVHADVSHHLLGSNQQLYTRVIGARPSIGDDGSVIGRQLYVDDGIYGSLCKRADASSAPAFTVGYDQSRPEPHLVAKGQQCCAEKTATVYDELPCTIWGQTCDSLDKVMVTAAGQLPAALGLGDWMSFAVPLCSGNNTDTGFNGYDAPIVRFMVHTGFEE